MHNTHTRGIPNFKTYRYVPCSGMAVRVLLGYHVDHTDGPRLSELTKNLPENQEQQAQINT